MYKAMTGLNEQQAHLGKSSFTSPGAAARGSRSVVLQEGNQGLS